MKTKFFIAAFTVLIINSAFTTLPGIQSLPKIKQATVASLDFFRTHRQGKAGITATWEITSAIGVAGFSLERTYEDPSDPYANWEMVSMMPHTGARSYKFTDTNIFPGFITYRLVSVMTSGEKIISGISTVHIVQH
jgi:hypothetical protein